MPRASTCIYPKEKNGISSREAAKMQSPIYSSKCGPS